MVSHGLCTGKQSLAGFLLPDDKNRLEQNCNSHDWIIVNCHLLHQNKK